MSEYANLVISVDSRQVKAAEGDLNKLGATAGKAGKATDGLGSAFRRLAGPLAAVISARQISQAAEDYTNLTNRLRLVTEGTDQLVYAQQSVFEIAQRTRQPLEATGELYQRIAQNASRLGLTFSEVEDVAETVSKSIALSGTSAAGAEAGLRQFGQALASGALRGDELNSVLENTPALAQTIARGLGVTVGEMRRMGSEGELTSEKLIDALQKQKSAVDEAAGAMQVTASQALTTFGNSLTAAIGKLNDATGASNRFATSILDLSSAIDRFGSGEFLDFFRDDKQTVAGFNNEISVTLSKIRDLSNARSRLDKNDPDDQVLFGFKLYDRNELSKEITDLERDMAALRKQRDALERGGNGAGSQTPPGDKPAEAAAAVNQEYEKLLANLRKQADLYGVVSEEAKVRYAIEKGELGQLTKIQQDEILAVARSKDGKAEAAKQSKGYSTALSEEQKEIARLLESYASQEEAMQREVALFGQTTEVARIRYEIENGELSKLNGQQQERLVLLAEEVDRLNQNQELEREVARIREASMTEEQRANRQIQDDYANLEAALRANIYTEAEYRQAVLDRAQAYARAAEDGQKSAEELDEFAKNAIQSFQGELSNTFKDTLTGDFDDIGRSWVNLLNQMAADAFAAEISRALFGKKGDSGGFEGGLLTSVGELFKGSSGTGGWLSAIGSLLSYDGGGYTGSGPRAGGLDGKGGFLAMMHPQETVTDHTKPGGQTSNSQTNNVTINLSGISNAREARESTATIQRAVARGIASAGRYT